MTGSSWPDEDHRMGASNVRSPVLCRQKNSIARMCNGGLRGRQIGSRNYSGAISVIRNNYSQVTAALWRRRR
jgi:hypothetical protein